MQTLQPSTALSPDTVQAFVAWYAARIRRHEGRHPSPKTLSAKASRMRAIARYAGDTTIESIATTMGSRLSWEQVLDKMHAQGLAPGSITQTVQAGRDLGEYLIAKGLITEHHVRPEDRPGQGPQKPVTVYTAEEVEAFIAAARGNSLRWWALLTTLADTGRRINEVLALEWTWLHLESPVPHFNLPHTKNGRQQYVPLTDRLVEQVFTADNIAKLKADRGRRSRDPEVYVFPWRYAACQQRFEKFCDTTGLPYRGFHCFRHTRATALLAKGVPIQAVSALLGHASVQTTDRQYNHATALSFAQYID